MELYVFTPLILNYNFHLPSPTRSSSLQSLPLSSSPLTFFLLVSSIFVQCFPWPTCSPMAPPHPPPPAASLALCSPWITMKDRVLIISIHFSPRLAYTFQISPKIYDINILSLSKCGLMGRTAMRTNRESHDYLY